MGDEREYIYNCSVCKAEVDVDAEICPHCGADLRYIIKSENSDNPYNAEKVGGWLLFFCITLTIIGPLLTFVSIVDVIRRIPIFETNKPDFATFIRMNNIVIAAVQVFGIYAGIRLWQKRPGAVNLVKKFLITILVYNIIFALICAINFDISVWIAVLHTLIFVGIWYTYLDTSKRVRYTFPPAEDQNSELPGEEPGKR